MTRPRSRAVHQPSETQHQTGVVELAEWLRFRAFHVHDSRRGLGAGWPDLALLHRDTGAFVLAELKTATGRVSVPQQGWIDDFYKGGLIVHVWRPAHLRNGQIEATLRAAIAEQVTP